MSKKKAMKVVVTTEHRGVFFGELVDDKSPVKLTLKDARMCVFWAQDVKGVVGLASSGPSKSCRITFAAPTITLYKITSVMECSVEAINKWESGPWN